ncbi:phospholipid transport system transporter-binding protein [Ectothiorhodospira magna]|uniref:Phospholipid transport system transporter-binding protein n=1 Tax=Ectothiorhodospira magna TaxID=867345 RepID=A0A1H9EL12_9GAMM|nr:STAS domain-containing protein [Ectothiorhodospira magna]SEQ26446.1 phospholipid transport system transporter-binding protein [Ectothiorhodospira magna]
MSEARLERTEAGIRVMGELTLATVPDLWRESRTLLQGGSGPCRVDLSGVTRSDSAGVALLVGWMKDCGGTQGGPLVFTGMPEHMQALVAVSDLEDVLRQEA